MGFPFSMAKKFFLIFLALFVFFSKEALLGNPERFPPAKPNFLFFFLMDFGFPFGLGGFLASATKPE